MITSFNWCRILFACLFFIFPTLIFSQEGSIHLKRGRLFTADGFELKFLNLNQQGEKITIENHKGKFTVYDKSDILRIDQRSGSEALVWGGYIGGVALLESWLLVEITKSSIFISADERRRQDRIVIIGSTVIGTLVGLLIGGSKNKYKRVYDDPELGFSPDKLGLNFSSPNNISSLTLSYHF